MEEYAHKTRLPLLPAKVNKDITNVKRKLKGQSRMDNPEKLATLGTQGTGQRQYKKHNTEN